MRKTDGTFTYFVPDVAYHLAKFDRGFTKAINIQGSDHHGTIARVRIGFQAAAKQLGMQVPGLFPDYVLHKMLKVIRDGQEVKMSKRSGTYVTLRDLVNWHLLLGSKAMNNLDSILKSRDITLPTKVRYGFSSSHV